MTTSERITELLTKYPADARAWRGWERKGSGGFRPIAKPNKPLKKWLREMNKALNAHHGEWPKFVHGGVKNRSYISFARPHVGKSVVIALDVRDCFGSITTKQVAETIQASLGLDRATSQELAGRLCFKGKVAQGFPTSNFVCNLYLLDPLTELSEDFSHLGYCLTNYVDDLALSGDIISPALAVDQMALSLSRAGLAISKKRDKLRVMPATSRQVICGLLVNRRLTLTKSKKLELLSSVARGTMNEASLDGWIANLKTVDPAFGKKLDLFATKKRIRSSDA